uniref:Galectin n=1 Tax=Syphacia muris TaxID=451379 RepID=A0A0N5ANG1_9BILA
MPFLTVEYVHESDFLIKCCLAQFDINLLHDGAFVAPGVEVVLHISVRFDERQIVFNTYEDNGWKKEERVTNPFKKGQEFDIRIRMLDNAFEIMGNQILLHKFKYRLQPAIVNFFSVTGDCVLYDVLRGGRFYSLPYETLFEGSSFKFGDRIIIYGRPIGQRFEVNLLGRNSNTLFHYNPRFNEKCVVRNACTSNVWGDEERKGQFPFKKGVGFDLMFVNHEDCIQVYYNNKSICNFFHRTPDPNNDYFRLAIAGDMEMTGNFFSAYSHSIPKILI